MRNGSSDIIHIQEKQGNFFHSFKLDLTYPEFYKYVCKCAKPGVTMICGSFGHGDLLMLTPTLRALRELLPDNPIHVYCGPKEFCIAENNPNIDLLVAVPFNFHIKSSKRTFSHLCKAYDRAFCLNNIIYGNPEAEIFNAYELMAKKIGVRLNSFIPDYFALSSEKKNAKQALETVGIKPEEDRIAVIQPKSSSLLRTFPDDTIEPLLQRLESSGWKAVVFWDNMNLPDKASQFGYWTSRDFQHLTLRELFALTYFSNVVIATDSVLSHLSAALDIPSVLLYGPFLAELRMLHFPRAYSIQSCLTCSPCFRHGRRCQIEGKGIPSCMKSFDVESIIEAVNTVIRPNYNSAKKKAANFQQELKKSKCRMCGCTEMTYFARKKDTLYFRCCKCSTTQSCLLSNNHSLVSLPRQHFKRSAALLKLLPTLGMLIFKDTSNPLLFDFGDGKTPSVKMLEDMGCEVENYEPNLHIISKPWSQNRNYFTELDQMLSLRRNHYDVITILDSFQYMRETDVVLSKLMNSLKIGGWLVLTLFSAENIVFLARTPVIDARDSCIPPLFPSVNGLDTFLGEFGLRRIWHSKIPRQTNSIFMYQKE